MKIAIIRGSSIPVTNKYYNVQEIGLALALGRLDVQVDVYMVSQGKEFTNQKISNESSARVNLHALPCYSFPGHQGVLKKLFKFLSDKDYDILQVQEDIQISSIIVAKWGKNKGIPVVLSQGLYQNYKNFPINYLHKLYDKILLPILKKSISLSICKTKAAEDYLKSKGFMNTVVLPVGLNEKNIANINCQNWREKLQIPQNSYIFLYVGKIEKHKNVTFMINIIEKLIKSVDVYLIIAGSGPEQENYKTIVKNKKLEKKVKFLGQVSQDNLPSLYKEANLFLFPTSFEIYGMVLLECMYFGTPPVANAVAGPNSIIKNNEDGILIEGLNLDIWAEEIYKLLDDNKLLRLGKNAHKKVCEQLTWDNLAPKYKKVYYDVIQEYKSGDCKKYENNVN